MRVFTCVLYFFANACLCQAMLRPGWLLRWQLEQRQQESQMQVARTVVDPKYGPFYFDQPVDHTDAAAGTFKHRYWANTDWYQPGGPVILYNAGELPADWRAGYVTNSSMAMLAEELNGIVIVMEHRCYGESMIAEDYSADNLRTLNTDQALEDMANIIRHVKLPNLDVDLPPAPQTRWIVYGGSYSGNLAAWMRHRYPDIVFAAVPSSAPVEMRYNFHQYFEAIRRYAPQHCVSAIQQVIRYVDHILFSPLREPKLRMKATFGLQDLAHDDDFAEVLSFPLGLWQDMTPTENPFVNDFCTIFDGKNTLHENVEAYGSYIASLVNATCSGSSSVNACLDTHDPRSDMYMDVKADLRPWFWQICTEYAYWQTAAPIWRPTMVSRKLTTNWYQRQCPFLFGEHNVPNRPAWRQINSEYEGWHLRLSRVIWLDGEWDPWRTLSVNSDDAPDRTHWHDNAHFQTLSESVHHWDFFVTNTTSTEIKDLHRFMVTTFKQWLDEQNKPEHTVRYQQ